MDVMNLDKIKGIALSAAIAIILALFVNVGVATFYKEPKYEECYYPTKLAEPDGRYVPPTAEELKQQRDCEDRNNVLRSFYNRNVFIVLVITGIASLLIGLFMGVSSVASGFLFGGILNLFIGVVRYWSDMDEYIRFILLGVVLALLIWIGYKKLR